MKGVDTIARVRRELDEDRSALCVDEGVDFGREPASGTTQTAIDTPLLAVAPCWWTPTPPS